MIIQDNPFNKANPFKLNQYDKFQHPYHINHKNEHQHLIYQPQVRPNSNKILQNNWTFNQDNLSKRHDFTRKQDLNTSHVSQFQMKIKMANIGVPYHRNTVKVSQGKLENPFFRKNLLVNKEEVMNQVQLDVTMYRNKAKSSYQTAPSSYIPVNYSETPVLTKNRPSYSEYQKPREVVDSQYIPNQSPSLYNSLKYSKTPELTQRVSERQVIQQPQNVQQSQHPQTIIFKGKKFFLN